MPTELTGLLLGQWQSAQRLREIVTEINTPFRDEAHTALEAIERNRDVDTAEGVWLDLLGARVGLRRPSTTDPSTDLRFGFTGPTQSRGFDQVPFRGDAANAAYYPLPDAVFRRFVKARAITILGDGTTETFRRAVTKIDEGAAVQDRRNMVVRVVTAQRKFVELADECGAIPRTAGVRIEYAVRGAFGFDSAGVGFDQGPFGTG